MNIFFRCGITAGGELFWQQLSALHVRGI